MALAAVATTAAMTAFNATTLGLRETPLRPSAEVASLISDLSFRCASCGNAILPAGSVQRITVRMTPLRRHGSKREARSTGLFAHSADGVALSEEASAFPPHLSNFREPAFSRDVRCGRCDRYLGYRIENAGGELMSGIDGRPPYKLWQKCGELAEGSAPAEESSSGAAVGSVSKAPHLHNAKCPANAQPLSLDSIMAWEALEARLPPEPASASSLRAIAPNGVERTTRLLEGGRVPPNAKAHVDFLRKETARAVAACEAGKCLLRTLSFTEADPHHAGLAPRNPSNVRVSPASHVRGERESPYISLSRNLSDSLPWALPYGRSVIVVPRWAEHTGAGIISPERVQESIRDTDGLPVTKGPPTAPGEETSGRLLRHAAQSTEALIKGHVSESTVELINAAVSNVAAGPIFSAAAASGAASTTATEARVETASSFHYPGSADEFRAMAEVAMPQGEPRADMGGRTPADYLARRGVIALGRPGKPEPSFLLVRMTPNKLPDEKFASITDQVPSDGGGGAPAADTAQTPATTAPAATSPSVVQQQKERLGRVLAAGGRQLRFASADCTDCAYYELDVDLSQPQRLVFPSLHDYTVERVGVVLIPWGPRAVDSAYGVARRKEEYGSLKGPRA